MGGVRWTVKDLKSCAQMGGSRKLNGWSEVGRYQNVEESIGQLQRDE